MQQNQFDEVLVAIRKIIRAIDLQSKKLMSSHGLTGPQALILKETGHHGALTTKQLSEHLSLSQATITDIVKRLEHRGLLSKERSTTDRRQIIITLTKSGQAIVKTSPPLLQERFESSFSELEEWERHQLLYSVKRLASMMDADDIDASPLLDSGSIHESTVSIGKSGEENHQADMRRPV